MKKLRILHIRNSSFFGSPEKLILSQMTGLSDRFEFELVVLQDGPNGAFVKNAADHSIPVRSRQSEAGTFVSDVLWLRRVLFSRRFDIVCSHDYKSNAAAFFASLGMKIRRAAVSHGRTSHNWKMKLYEAADHFFLKKMDAVAAVAAAQASSLPVSPGRVSVIHNAIPMPGNVEKLPADSFVVGAAGRLSKEKGFDKLIEAVTGLGVRLLIAGEGEERESLEALIRKNGLSDSVALLGLTEDMDQFYGSLDLFVLPSVREGLPLVLLEAAARGVPIVATRVGGVPEFIEDGVSGRLIPDNNPAHIEKAVRELKENKDLRRLFSENAAGKISADFSIESYLRKFDYFFTSLAKADTIWVSWERHRRTRELAQTLDIPLYELISSSSRIPRYFKLIWKTMRLIRSQKPKTVVIQVPSLVLALWAALLKPFYGFRLVMDAHNEAVDPYILRGKIIQGFLAWIHRRADAVVVTNDELKKAVEANHGTSLVLPDKLPALANGHKGDGTSVVFICTFAPDEPVAAVLEAAKSLPDGVKLFVTGNKTKANRRILKAAPDNVEFTGFLPEPQYEDLLRRADVIVDLTEMENCLVCGAYESVALGKPLVTSDTRALRSYFSKGAVYTNHDPASLAASIAAALEQSDRLRSEMVVLKQTLTDEWEKRFKDFYGAVHLQ